MPAFLGQRKLVAGRIFDEGRAFGRHLDELRKPGATFDASQISEDEVVAACELVIDTRLARVGKYQVGDTVKFLGRDFRIVGIVESGVAGRVLCSLHVLQFVKNGGIPWVSLFFVQLKPPAAGQSRQAATSSADAETGGVGYEERVADGLTKLLKAKVEPKGAYREMMYQSFSQIYLYINLASGVALVVCFIIILLSMYTMVLERTREIGILKSLGAGRGYLIGQSITEAVVVCGTGTVIGVGMAFATKIGIEAFRPLLTLTIEPAFILLALAIGIVGGMLSALYPGYRAARLDPVVALGVE
jgi:putative ABC transport system permease protein